MSRDSETFRLLLPGLMLIEELKEVISQRGIRPKGSESKHQLVEIYEQQLQPLSQRKFPNTLSGELLNKRIAEEDRKKSKSEPKACQYQYGFKEKSSANPSTSGVRHHSSSQSTTIHKRLKPPVDSGIPAKKICLSRRPSSDNSLDKIIINDRSKKSANSHNEKSSRKSSNDIHNEKPDNKPTVEKVHTSPSKESVKEDKGSPKEKRKRIAWP